MSEETSTTPTLTPRQRLMETLNGDLNTQGWNQKNKVWFMRGDVGDEWLEFVGEFEGAPEDRVVDMIANDEIVDGVNGILLATEGWGYPKQLTDSFENEEALRAYWRLVPPSEHPQKVEIRQLILSTRDGEVIGLHSTRGVDDTQWATLDITTVCPTGDRTIDASRAALGMYDDLVTRVKRHIPPGESIRNTLSAVSTAIEQAMSGEISPEQATLNLFMSVPEDVRKSMIKQMPPELREVMREVLSPEERDKYGL